MARKLPHLRVLIIDCQTTGASPERGHLLELGWCVWRATDPEPHPDQTEARLLKLPRNAAIPPHIARMTGITRSEFRRDAEPAAVVWSDLSDAIDSVARDAASRGEEVIAVAHYVRFEEQFLRHFHGKQIRGAEFPLRFVCTHQIARRLFPDLPRRGIRALAGYFGFPLPETKRVTPNVVATAKIWRQLIETLHTDHRVASLADLDSFLDIPAPSRSARFEYPLSREKRLGLPEDSGVYRFLGGDQKVLYVGKATSLKSRVNSYYKKRRGADRHLELVSQARDVQVTVTPTALEAALLEADEIRTLDPPYNKALRNIGRDVWFCSHDLKRLRSRSSRTHRVGPLPDRDGVDALLELARILNSPEHSISNEKRTANRLGIDPRWLASGALVEGLQLFAEENALLDEESSPRSLLRLGKSLMNLSLEEEQIDETDENGERGDENAETKRDKKLDPEQVWGFLNGVTIHGVRLVRRARWLAHLSESTLCWETRMGRSKKRRFIILEQGQVIESGDLRAREVPPDPPGLRLPMIDRIQNLDRASYDRLRVLTTELRRILSAGREVDIHWSPGRRIGSDLLAVILPRI